jgi:N-acetylglucosaminyldiphosphoundecaprenol N-acetyl-beta-D-mannosaminyltransferase
MADLIGTPTKPGGVQTATLPGIRALLRERRFNLGPLSFDVLEFADALSAITELVMSEEGGTVFTPNVDHAVRASREADFREAYARTRLALPDGMPLVWTARMSGQARVARVTGADLVMPLMDLAAARGWGVYLLGGREGASQAFLARLARELPTLRIVGIGPRTGEIRTNPSLLDQEVPRIRALRPELVLVCLGSPLQELWADRVAATLRPTLFFGLGSAMDVAAGLTPRAPSWLQRSGFEWLYRLGSDPRRLWKRYLVDDIAFLPIALRVLYGARLNRP